MTQCLASAKSFINTFWWKTTPSLKDLHCTLNVAVRIKFPYIDKDTLDCHMKKKVYKLIILVPVETDGNPTFWDNKWHLYSFACDLEGQPDRQYKSVTIAFLLAFFYLNIYLKSSPSNCRKKSLKTKPATHTHSFFSPKG